MCLPRDGTASASPDLPGYGDCEFVIECARDIQIVVRLLGLVAQRDLGVGSISMNSLGENATLAVRVEGLSELQADIIAEKMRCVIGVTHVAPPAR